MDYIVPQMSDRCYTEYHLFQICLTSVDNKKTFYEENIYDCRALLGQQGGQHIEDGGHRPLPPFPRFHSHLEMISFVLVDL